MNADKRPVVDVGSLIDLFRHAGVDFGDFGPCSLDDAQFVVFGVPFDGTASFCKGSRSGPAAIRRASSELVETYLLDYGVDLAQAVKLHDLGDYKLPVAAGAEAKSGGGAEDGAGGGVEAALEALEGLTSVVCALRAAGKVPLCLGGEHTVTWFLARGVARERPVLLHLDAHQDFKPSYEGRATCHATPFYQLTREAFPGSDVVQVGVRQADPEEERLAAEAGVTTYTSWDVRDGVEEVAAFVREKTAGRPTYVSVDVDVLDAPFVPATGTPVSFGLTPEQVLRVLTSVAGPVVGVDLVEVGLDPNYREAEVATQLLFRLLAHAEGFSPKRGEGRGERS
ncbi:MAG: agmatinase [Promethearchaeota archaeon]